MNHLKHILFASALVASMSAAAQETYQDTKLAASQLTGTARYVGMGGAMEALGADISTISTNPAGVGLFRKNQISLSAGVIAQSGADNSISLGNSTIDIKGKKSHPTFDQVGIVWSTKMRNSSALNLAFNYHKSTDFGQLLNAANSLTKASQNKLSAAKNAEGVDGWSAADANFGGYRIMQASIRMVCLASPPMVPWLSPKPSLISSDNISMATSAATISTSAVLSAIEYGSVLPSACTMFITTVIPSMQRI